MWVGASLPAIVPTLIQSAPSGKRVAVKTREREHLFERSPSFKKWINVLSAFSKVMNQNYGAKYFFAGIGVRDIKKL